MEAVKHRTQISLDDWQYQLLLDLSRKTRKSLSALIREMITEKLAPKAGVVAEGDPLYSIVGMGSSGQRHTARTHDAVLYGTKK